MVSLPKPNDAVVTNSVAIGSTVRIGPNDLVTNDAQLLYRMSAARSTYTRSGWYNTQEVDTRGWCTAICASFASCAHVFVQYIV